MAPWYVRSVQLGLYTWRKRRNWGKICSKMAHFTSLGNPKGSTITFGKTHFGPMFDPFFWSQNGPFSRHLGIFHCLKCVTTGSKWARITCLGIPGGVASLVEKKAFDPFWTRFWSQNGPFSRHFGIFHGPKHVTTGSKGAKNTCLSSPRGGGTSLEKIFFSRPGNPGGPTVGPRCPRPGLPSASTK